MKKLVLFIGLILILAGFGSLFSPTAKQTSSKTPANKTSVATSSDLKQTRQTSGQKVEEESLVLVKRVVDGDTVELSTGQKVRYIGINTPETVDPRATVQCFGKEASAKNKELVEGKRIRLEKDVSETDKYGRLLRYVWVGNTFVNDYLVKEGFAYASSYPPDVKYQDLFRSSQDYALSNKKGLWTSCESGQVLEGAVTNNQSQGSCLIKGNISGSGEKIYHLPGQRYYNQTVIDENKGEQWFCTVEEAVKAGWRRSKV